MADTKKCAHVPCTCQTDQKYCSEFCEEAGAEEVEIGCDCGHPACIAEASLAS
jgi:hypothetical protein